MSRHITPRKVSEVSLFRLEDARPCIKLSQVKPKFWLRVVQEKVWVHGAREGSIGGTTGAQVGFLRFRGVE